MKYNIFWFRRDLRLQDNTALNNALNGKHKVIPIFIFDENILNELPEDDPRLQFIYNNLHNIDKQLKKHNSSILCLKGKPLEIWQELIEKYAIDSVYVNKDYEPYATQRDLEVQELLKNNNIELKPFKDQVIFEELEITKSDGLPYTIYTPYKNKWLDAFKGVKVQNEVNFEQFHKNNFEFPTLASIGFKPSEIKVKEYTLSVVENYGSTRDSPEQDATSYLSPHLRFGTISIRQVIDQLEAKNEVFLSELIWREFFMQILFNFPKVVNHNFKSKYDGIAWRNNQEEFDKWCKGETGYPMVDAGMRQLNKTGYMHNRVRMITAGFLCKHLLIDWRWGEAYFAKKLLDYELSANNGNWQWAAGTGCDAAPYFRVFNPITQFTKFDKSAIYVRRWIPEYGSNLYPKPMVDHKMARLRALDVYKEGIADSPF